MVEIHANYSKETITRSLGLRKVQQNEDSTIVPWDTDGAGNTNYQDIDLDSYYTVPEGCTAINCYVEVKDATVNNYCYIGATETDSCNYVCNVLVANGYHRYPLRLPLAAGNVIKIKCNVVPATFERMRIYVIEWCFD